MDITKIDKEITKQLELLKEEVNSIDLQNVCEFKLHEADKIIPWQDLVYKGIYLLEIKNDKQFRDFESWIENFKTEWENEDYLKKFTPNTKKVRIKAHKELGDWIPIYIGKSRNIGHRIHGHIYKE